jgi:hypothetical protein
VQFCVCVLSLGSFFFISMNAEGIPRLAAIVACLSVWLAFSMAIEPKLSFSRLHAYISQVLAYLLSFFSKAQCARFQCFIGTIPHNQPQPGKTSSFPAYLISTSIPPQSHHSPREPATTLTDLLPSVSETSTQKADQQASSTRSASTSPEA